MNWLTGQCFQDIPCQDARCELSQDSGTKGTDRIKQREFGHMVHIHGSWGHYVRPGHTDPKRYGTEAAMGLKKRKRKRKKVDTAKAKPGEFRIWGEDGGLLYQCAEKRAAPVRELLLRELPVDAYDEVEGGIRLRAKLDELGFGSIGDFAHWCSH